MRGGEDRGTLMCMIHAPVPHVPFLSTIPHPWHDIDQDILLNAGEAIESGRERVVASVPLLRVTWRSVQ